MNFRDFRSDTVTQPTPAMRRAMTDAKVGDDVYGDDPTVNRLEALGAEMLGKEAAIFTSSGTQANLLALLSHCDRGDEYIVGQEAHTYRWEGGGAAVFGSIVPQPIEFETDGTLDLEKVAAKIKPIDFHFARTRLFCLENTTGGKVLPQSYIKQAEEFARIRGLSFHLDGARIFNASVKLGLQAKEISRYFDTVSVCLSKGLGAPVGSLLCGPAEFIGRARRWRKVLGGGMRQAGIIAAGGIYALQHNIDRLAEDHENAAVLAEGLSGIEEVEVLPYSGTTNMVFMKMLKGSAEELAAMLRSRGIIILDRSPIRLVTHLDVDRQAVLDLVKGVKEYFKKNS